MNLPPLAPYPPSAVQQQIPVADWAVFVAAWLSLAQAYLDLRGGDFGRVVRDGVLEAFLVSYVSAEAQARAQTNEKPQPPPPDAAALKKTVFLLTARVLVSKAPPPTPTQPPPPALLQWSFLADFARVYGRRRVAAVLGGSPNSDAQKTRTTPHHLPAVAVGVAEASLSALKKTLIKSMEMGAKGDHSLQTTQAQLQRVNYLVAAWPAAGAQLLAGSDFLDTLVACYPVAPLPLRRTMVTTAYLCLLALTEPPTPRFSQLSDVLYAVRAAANDSSNSSHSSNANTSLVAELVTTTPLLQQLRQRTEAAGTATNRILPIVRDLEEATHSSKKQAGMAVPARRGKTRSADKGKADKGKGPEVQPDTSTPHQLHPHKVSSIAQIQDLFPDLGSAFVAKLLDAYADSVEQVVAHLLEDDLPAHLRDADRTQNLAGHAPVQMAPHSTPPLPPLPPTSLVVPDLPPLDYASARANVYDGDDLALRLKQNKGKGKAKVHFGKHASARTADDVLRDRSGAPAAKAAILSALAAFDADDDERDDTYDAVDIGGAVEARAAAATGGDGDANDDALDAALMAAYVASPALFARDAATRRSVERRRLRDDTHMTDEALEGWAVMLERNPQRRRRLEARLADGGGPGGGVGNQNEIARTAWRATDNDDDDGEDGDGGGGEGSARGGHRGRGRGRGGGPRGRGNVAGPTGDRDTEAARRRKEASKGSRANHNRRDGHARKMARGM